MDRRSLTQWLGAALFAFTVAAVAVVGVPPPGIAVQMLLLAAAGALFFAGGVTDSVRWGLLVGLGNVALGASLLLSAALDYDDGAGGLAYTAAVVVGGLALAAIGVGYVVEHDAFDTDV
ncbi:hypothetical protein [Halobacterium yunchengense]|uniref:hypothetical protein n=1 Tax=Halobacterium yunchengense TaxID=3108497 RepID=UPI00300A00D0